jgi:hypothetical protein
MIFCSTEFNESFPLATAKAWPRNPGPDGISFRFYQKIWDFVKDDMLDLFLIFTKIS